MIRKRCLSSARSIAIALSFLSLLYVVGAGAQTSRIGASLHGTVTDGTGGVIPKVRITLRHTLTNQIRTVITDDQGLFRAEQLAVGIYEASVEQTHFAIYRHAGIQVSLGQTVYLNIVLAPASESASVVVSAQPSVMDTSETSVVSSIDQERIEEGLFCDG